jgi:hypothetical protein
MIARREWLKSVTAMAALGAPVSRLLAHPTLEGDLLVWKSASCGCCKQWVEHMKSNGFHVVVHDVEDVGPYKKKYHVSDRLASCHTAYIDGYVIEGHVPAADVRRLLKQKPMLVGLAVPGMPSGSPGMEGPRKDRFDVLTFDSSGKTTVFASY